MSSKADILINVSHEINFRECLESAIAQKGYGNILVTDRLNRDSIKDIVDSMNKPFLKYFNTGGQTPIQTCISLANLSDAQWLKYICNNEILTPHCLETLLFSAESFDNITMSFGGLKTIYQDGSSTIRLFDFPEYIGGQDYLFNIYKEIPFKTLSNTLVKKSIIPEINIRSLPDRLFSIHGIVAMYAMINGNLTYVNEVTAITKESGFELPATEELTDNLEHIINPCNYALTKLPNMKLRINTLKDTLLTEEIKEITHELINSSRYRDAFRFLSSASNIRFSTVLAVLFSHNTYKPLFKKLFAKLQSGNKDT